MMFLRMRFNGDLVWSGATSAREPWRFASALGQTVGGCLLVVGGAHAAWSQPRFRVLYASLAQQILPRVAGAGESDKLPYWNLQESEEVVVTRPSPVVLDAEPRANRPRPLTSPFSA